MTERRFGTYNKFGTGSKFGASTTTADALTWGVEVDWDQDGFFDGSNEFEYMIGIPTIFRGRDKWIDSTGEGFEPIRTGKAVLKFDNSSGRYDAYNTASPLYPNVTYGAECRITVRDLSGTAAAYPVFYGFVTNVEATGYGENSVAQITVEDGWRYLRDYTARAAIQTNISPSTAVQAILSYLGWRWGVVVPALDTDVINYWWANGNRIASSEIVDITNSFLGYFFIDASGQAVYKARLDGTETSVLDLSQEQLLKDISNPRPYEYNRNVTRIKAHPRTTTGTVTVFQEAGITPLINNGDSETFWANFTYNNAAVPVSSVVQPVATTDYTFNSQSNGLGTDLTSSVSVVVTPYGDTGYVRITNNSGSNAYRTSFKIRGTAVYEPATADKTYPSDVSTVVRPREFKLDLLWQQDLNVVTDFLNLLGPFFDSSQPFPVIQLMNYPSLQFTPELFDIITVAIPYLGIDGNSFRVAGIEHESIGSENCQSILTKFYLESYLSIGDGWTWDITDFGVNTTFTA